jgi:glycosyltransferase involved in cell wall biosynthesis|tara:strand:- start:1296 stop:2291 length:996 start_codon:yes stop_codon:yes gene_type:complete
MRFSFIIPVFNRPAEVDELLESLTFQTYNNFDTVIVEDGSTFKCDKVIDKYKSKLDIQYYFKSNSGPGPSRNYGVDKSNSEYFIFCDSDCIIPPMYLQEVQKQLKINYTDVFGGPDNAHSSFTPLQKAINYAMTAFITTGGIRGGEKSIGNFQPRSFNMGISKYAFSNTGGFGSINPGEDPDLIIRLWKLGYETQLISKAFVYHKRRISWAQFYKQVNKFGKCRPILNSWHPETSKITYWFPTCFILGLAFGLVFSIAVENLVLMYFYALYFIVILFDSSIRNKNIKIGLMSIIAVFIQYLGYGIGFLKAFIFIKVLKYKPENAFPYLFLK